MGQSTPTTVFDEMIQYSTHTILRKPWRDIFTYYLSLITYYLLLITYYLSLITYYLLLIISYINPYNSGKLHCTFPVIAVAVEVEVVSGFIWAFRKLPFPSHLGKYCITTGKISAKIHEFGKMKTIFGLGMTPI